MIISTNEKSAETFSCLSSVKYNTRRLQEWLDFLPTWQLAQHPLLDQLDCMKPWPTLHQYRNELTPTMDRHGKGTLGDPGIPWEVLGPLGTQGPWEGIPRKPRNPQGTQGGEPWEPWEGNPREPWEPWEP